MEKFENLGLEEMTNEEMMNIDGGSPAGYWAGFIIAAFAGGMVSGDGTGGGYQDPKLTGGQAI